MTVIERHPPARHRAIFLSDIHLGTRGCQAEMLLDFLKKNECEHLYLVGDIVDGWRLKRWWYWPQAHNDVVQKILRKARKGTNVVYIPGNHDEAARQYCQLTFGDVRVRGRGDPRRRPTARKLLVIHGDQFDGIVRYATLARDPGRLGLHRRAARQHDVQLGPPQARPALLVAVGLPQAQGQERGPVHRQLRGRGRERSAPPRRRRRGVRPHPSRRDPHHRRRALLQRRRLGGELHGAGRGFRRPPAHRPLGRGTCARASSTLPRLHAGAAGGGVDADCASPSSPTPGVRRSMASCAPSRPSSQLLQAEGHDVEVFGPDRFRTLPCPTYPEIRLSLFPAAASRPHAEAVRARCDPSRDRGAARLGGARLLPQARASPSPRAYHTRFPEYVRARIRVPLAWSYAFVRRFHAPSSAVLVVAQSIRDELSRARLQEPGAVVARRRHRGFHAAAARRRRKDARPIWLYAGRVAIEKNIKAFLDLDLPGTKWVVGGGPQLKELKRRYKDARFFGSVDTEELSRRYAEADCFVFPEPHRHVRPGHGRGAGLRRAGRGLSGARPARRRDRARCRRGRRGSAHGLPRRDTRRPRRLSRATPRPSPGQAAPSSSATTLRPIPRSAWQPLPRRVLPDAAAS